MQVQAGRDHCTCYCMPSYMTNASRKVSNWLIFLKKIKNWCERFTSLLICEDRNDPYNWDTRILLKFRQRDESCKAHILNCSKHVDPSLWRPHYGCGFCIEPDVCTHDPCPHIEFESIIYTLEPWSTWSRNFFFLALLCCPHKERTKSTCRTCKMWNLPKKHRSKLNISYHCSPTS